MHRFRRAVVAATLTVAATGGALLTSAASAAPAQQCPGQRPGTPADADKDG